MPIDIATIGRLEAGSPKQFRVHLEKGQTLSVSVEQRELDVVMALLDPGGSRVREVDGQSGVWGTEALWWSAQTSGPHTIQLRPWSSQTTGDYRLWAEVFDDCPPRIAARVRASELLHGVRSGDATSPPRVADWQRARELWRAVGEHEQELLTLLALASLQAQNHRPDGAFETYQLALREIDDRVAPRLRVVLRHRLASHHRRHRDTARSQELLQQALELAIANDDPWGRGVSGRLLAEVAADRKEFRTALTLGRTAVADLRQTRDPFELANALRDLGVVLSLMGRRDEALEAYQEVRALRRDQGDWVGLANVSTEIGWLHYLEDQIPEAIAIYEEALDLHRQTNNLQGETGTLDRLGSAWRSQKRWQLAETSYRRALALAHQSQNRADLAHTLCNLAELEVERGSPDAAIDNLDRAFVHFLALDPRDRSGEAHGLFLRSRAHAASGEIAEARIASREVLAVLAEIEEQLANETLQLPYLSVRREYLDHHLELLRQSHDAEPGEGWDSLAFLAAERWRARNLVRHLEREGATPERRARRERIEARLGTLAHRQTLAIDDEEAARLERQIRSLTDDLGRVVATDGPSATRSLGPELDELQALLDDDTLVLVLHLASTRSQLWVLDHQRLESYVLPGRSILESAARDMRRSMQNSHTLMWRDQARLDAEHLGSLIFIPILHRLRDQRLVLITDGALNSIPLASLRIPDRAGSLLDHHEVARVPSLGALLRLRERRRVRRPAPKTLAVVADPIFSRQDPRLDPMVGPRDQMEASAATQPLRRAASELDVDPFERLQGSGEEAAKIAAIVPGEDFLALGFAADRARILGGDLSGYRIIHFATHGLLHPRHHELSGLVLTLLDPPGNPRNGYLRAYEVSGLHLPADLVVLSACQTALGAEMRGEGLLGLPRSFFQAGASQVVVSLWRVNDQATASLMERFYHHLVVDHQPPITALRSAQRWLASRDRWGAPYFWAAFELQGDWEERIFDEP